MDEDRCSLGAATASSTTPSGSQSWSARPARQRPTLGIPSSSAKPSGLNFGSGNYHLYYI